MPSALEDELVEIYEREIENLALTNSKYNSILGATEIATAVRAFRIAIEHGVDKVTAQMLYDIIDSESEAMVDFNNQKDASLEICNQEIRQSGKHHNIHDFRQDYPQVVWLFQPKGF